MPESKIGRRDAERGRPEACATPRRVKLPDTVHRVHCSENSEGSCSDRQTRLFTVGGTILNRRMRGVDDVFKALADASRRKLLDELHKNDGQTLGELCGHLAMTRQAVTKHLALLETANLVAVVWRGREKLHYLNPVPIHEISERWIEKYQRQHLDALGDLKKRLEQEKEKHDEAHSPSKRKARR